MKANNKAADRSQLQGLHSGFITDATVGERRMRHLFKLQGLHAIRM